MRNSAISISLGIVFLVRGGTMSGQPKPVPPPDAGANPIPTVAQVQTWKQCREYLPDQKNPQCRIDFDMTQTKDGKNPPQTHKDITVQLGRTGRGAVVLWHSSPFAACSLATTVGPLTRDLSPNISSVLTSAAGAGAMPVMATVSTVTVSVGSAEVTAEDLQMATERANTTVNNQFSTQLSQRLSPQNRKKLNSSKSEAAKRAIQAETDKVREQKAEMLKKIEQEEGAINQLIRQFQKTQSLYDSFRLDNETLTDIRTRYFYSYSDRGSETTGDATARVALKTIQQDASLFLSRPLPDAKTATGLQDTLEKIVAQVDSLEKSYPNNDGVKKFVKDVRGQAAKASDFIAFAKSPAASANVSYYNDTNSKIQKIFDFITDWNAHDADQRKAGISTDASVQVLPIAVYPESKVAVTVKCADAITSAALFDNIQFNAYFQDPPRFDISSGLLVSTLHGRQATSQAPYSSISSPPSNPNNAATVKINRSRPQFVPGLFAEVHLINFKLPGVHEPADKVDGPPKVIPTWMSENAPRHPFGYVGSFGLAGGILVNPNNGTTQAEFYEGLSVGIQRFVLLVGNHTGRSQNLTDGYYEGAPVPAGTTVPTVSNWANGLAFGITYRIPLR